MIYICYKSPVIRDPLAVLTEIPYMKIKIMFFINYAALCDSLKRCTLIKNDLVIVNS